VKEELLQYIWKQQQFDQNDLRTTDGEELRILNPGVWNHLSGPDFSEARVEIGGTLWVGSVEVHMNAADWFTHKHHLDRNYDNVVLHVVLENDHAQVKKLGLPTLALNGRIGSNLIKTYHQLQIQKDHIPCQSYLDDVEPMVWRHWLDRMLVQRLERKTLAIEHIFERCKQDWLQTFHVLLSGYFGQNQNKEPFQEVALTLPMKTLLKIADRPRELKALAFGVAGLLEQLEEDEHQELEKLYRFQSAKLSLEPLSIPWKFGRIRPAAAPKVRLAQWAQFVPYTESLYQRSVRSDLRDWLRSADLQLQDIRPKVSRGFLETIYINAVVPFAFFYARQTGNNELMELSLDVLHDLRPEKNRVVRTWAAAGIDAKNTKESQSLIELYTHYCDAKKCVLCNVGQSIMRQAL